MDLNKIRLGTAKLDNPSYGYSSSPALNFNKFSYFDDIYNLGVRKLDTAPRYNGSEKLIGDYIERSNNHFSISSKIDGLTSDNVNTIYSSVINSIERLNVSDLDVCYLHQSDLHIISNQYIQDELLKLKEYNKVRNIGVSIYNADELEYAISSNIFDVVQFPLNIFDTSLYDGIIKKSNSRIKFVARSLLLQGIAGTYSQLDDHSFKKEIIDYKTNLLPYADMLGLTIPQLSFAYLRTFSLVSEYIMASNSIANLRENLSFFDYELPPYVIYELNMLSTCTKYWSNPKRWK